MADVSDKRRLRQVQQQDLTESRLNDDFVYWLKTKGINYLLIILVIACAVMFYNAYRQRRQQAFDASWSDLSQATLPQAFDEVAKKHDPSESIALFAWLKAADSHLRDVRTGYVGGPPVTMPDGTTAGGMRMTPEDRTAALDAADQYFTRVLSSSPTASETPGQAAFRLSALFGRASVAESRGDIAAAKTFLEEAKRLAEVPFPMFATQAQARIDSLPKLAKPTELPTRASLPARPDAAAITPGASNELLNSVTQPQPATGPEAVPPELRPTAPPAKPTPPAAGPTPPAEGPKPAGG